MRSRHRFALQMSASARLLGTAARLFSARTDRLPQDALCSQTAVAAARLFSRGLVQEELPAEQAPASSRGFTLFETLLVLLFVSSVSLLLLQQIRAVISSAARAEKQEAARVFALNATALLSTLPVQTNPCPLRTDRLPELEACCMKIEEENSSLRRYRCRFSGGPLRKDVVYAPLLLEKR